jgi:hypothetical protein
MPSHHAVWKTLSHSRGTGHPRLREYAGRPSPHVAPRTHRRLRDGTCRRLVVGGGQRLDARGVELRAREQRGRRPRIGIVREHGRRRRPQREGRGGSSRSISAQPSPRAGSTPRARPRRTEVRRSARGRCDAERVDVGTRVEAAVGSICSGLAYAGVPRINDACDTVNSATALAMPKSTTFTCTRPSGRGCRTTFDGLRSR